MGTDLTQSRFIALIVACAMFMAQLDGAVVALALPAISHSFGVAPVELTVGITAYLIVQFVFLPAGGWIAHTFGARTVFAAAIAVFTIASVLCALSHTLMAFVAARVLQGSAAALMAPVGRIVLLETTEKRHLVSVMTISTVPMLVAPTIGPALGGFITTYWSWHWIFLVNVPFGIAGMLLALRKIPAAPRVGNPRPFDFLGFLLFAGSSTLLLYGLQRLGDDYPHWVGAAALMVAGLAMAVTAFRHARRVAHPIVSLAPLDIPSFSIAAIRGGTLARLPVRALPYLLPMMFQLALGMDAMKAGILLLALNGGDLVLKVITTRTLRRFGFRNVLLASTGVSAVSIALCAFASADIPYTAMFAVLLVIGMVRSLLFSGLSALVFADVPPAELGSASILWNIVQQGTNVLGVSLSAILLAISAQLAGENRNQLSLHDFHVALIAMAAIMLLSLISLRRLAPDAGSAVSGHRSGQAAEGLG
jgi:EmrB/QacA subfamily drug resistance transporter